MVVLLHFIMDSTTRKYKGNLWDHCALPLGLTGACDQHDPHIQSPITASQLVQQLACAFLCFAESCASVCEARLLMIAPLFSLFVSLRRRSDSVPGWFCGPSQFQFRCSSNHIAPFDWFEQLAESKRSDLGRYRSATDQALSRLNRLATIKNATRSKQVACASNLVVRVKMASEFGQVIVR